MNANVALVAKHHFIAVFRIRLKIEKDVSDANTYTFLHLTYRSTDVADDAVVGVLGLFVALERGVDLFVALALVLFHGPLHIELGHGRGACQGSLAVESRKPPLVHVVEVVAADLLCSECHWGDLMGV